MSWLCLILIALAVYCFIGWLTLGACLRLPRTCSINYDPNGYDQAEDAICFVFFWPLLWIQFVFSDLIPWVVKIPISKILLWTWGK